MNWSHSKSSCFVPCLKIRAKPPYDLEVVVSLLTRVAIPVPSMPVSRALTAFSAGG